MYKDFEDQMEESERNIQLSQKIVKSLYSNMQKDLRKDHIGIIIDDTNLSIEECNEKYGNKHNIIYCLGTSEITPEEMEKRIIEYDTQDDWSMYISGIMRSMLCENIVNQSKKNKIKCEKFSNIKYIETSKKREKVLNQVVEDLEKLI